MADIRVTCPACKTQLEIGAEYEGQEVECGTCLEVFVASTQKPKPRNDADEEEKPAGRSGSGGNAKGPPSRTRGSRGSRGSRDRDDDDDDYEHDRKRRRDDYDDDDYDPRPSRNSGGSSGLAIAALILGILGLVPGCFCCWAGFPMSLLATVLGGVSMGTPQGKGMGIAGLVLGICGMIFNFFRGALTGFVF